MRMKVILMAVLAFVFVGVSQAEAARVGAPGFAYEDVDGDGVYTEGLDAEVSLAPDAAGNIAADVDTNPVIPDRMIVKTKGPAAIQLLDG